MNKCRLGLLLSILIVPNVWGESFLKPVTFPTTFEELSFTEQMDVIKQGYEPYESEYDNDGRCVKNCAYVGITLKQALEKQEVDTQNALTESLKYEQNQQQTQQDLPVDVKNILSVANCENRNYDIKVGQAVPWSEPVKGKPVISSPYGERIHPITGKKTLHEGIDYAVPVGTSVYTPADGRVVRLWMDTDGCGYGIKIKHGDGNSSVYCHLSKILVKEDENISAGCEIGLSGNSGRSTGPHLHYGLKDKQDRPIDASKYTGRGSGATSYSFTL